VCYIQKSNKGFLVCSLNPKTLRLFIHWREATSSCVILREKKVQKWITEGLLTELFAYNSQNFYFFLKTFEVCLFLRQMWVRYAGGMWNLTKTRVEITPWCRTVSELLVLSIKRRSSYYENRRSLPSRKKRRIELYSAQLIPVHMVIPVSLLSILIFPVQLYVSEVCLPLEVVHQHGSGQRVGLRIANGAFCNISILPFFIPISRFHVSLRTVTQ
jgi:hypothetical protein